MSLEERNEDNMLDALMESKTVSICVYVPEITLTIRPRKRSSLLLKARFKAFAAG